MIYGLFTQKGNKNEVVRHKDNTAPDSVRLYQGVRL